MFLSWFMDMVSILSLVILYGVRRRDPRAGERESKRQTIKK